MYITRHGLPRACREEECELDFRRKSFSISLDQCFFLFSSPLLNLDFSFAGFGKRWIFFEKYYLELVLSLRELSTAVLVVIFETLIWVFSDADVQVVV